MNSLAFILFALAIALPLLYRLYRRYRTVLQTLYSVLLGRGRAIPSQYALDDLRFCL
ncbi:MAG: hypothetical protein ACFB4I_17080 [Cyanophyceae cyanobacterium]